MTTHLYLVFSNPADGREDEYNNWYDKIHLADVAAVPGVVAARRLQLSPSGDTPPKHQYLAIYELEGDPHAVLATVRQRAGGSQMPISDALDTSSIETTLWRMR